MRRVAEALGAGTMTLYYYVRTKEDLLTLVEDALIVCTPAGKLVHRVSVPALSRCAFADEPALAARALSTAEDDWRYAIVGIEGPSTWHTPAFAATRLELAAIGATVAVGAQLDLIASSAQTAVVATSPVADQFGPRWCGS